MTQPDAATPEVMVAITREWFTRLWVDRNEAEVDQVIAAFADPNLTAYVEGADGGGISLEEWKQYRRALITSIPDMQVELRKIVAADDRCYVEWFLTGRHTGAGLGVPPSGKPVAFNGITSLTFKDGKILEGTDKWNRGEVVASLMQVKLAEIQAKTTLTPREAQVALLMAERRSHTEIAEDLHISPSTARRHCERVLSKLRVHRRQDVAAAIGKLTGSPLDRVGMDDDTPA